MKRLSKNIKIAKLTPTLIPKITKNIKNDTKGAIIMESMSKYVEMADGQPNSLVDDQDEAYSGKIITTARKFQKKFPELIFLIQVGEFYEVFYI